ncbi:MAG: EthD family reductase [Gammaproteobacteria bacterium]|nr:EthD family reductase [Gammaproteobacteria bacterium]
MSHGEFAPSSMSRREVLRGAGSAVTFGMLASAFGAVLPRGVNAKRSAALVDCMTIVYPAGADTRFDADYYRDHHLKLIMELYGNSIARFELRPALPAAAGAPPVPYAAAVNIWIADFAAMAANNEKHSKQLIDDVPNFTNAMPAIQFDKIHGEAGARRSAPKIGDTCLTILYPNPAGVRWDVDYYARHHMPLIMKLYGRRAIKRFELRKGDAAQAGGPPPYVGSINIYIENQKAFDAAGQQHTKALVDDVPNFSSVMPAAFATRIHGIGSS